MALLRRAGTLHTYWLVADVDLTTSSAGPPAGDDRRITADSAIGRYGGWVAVPVAEDRLEAAGEGSLAAVGCPAWLTALLRPR